MSKLPNRLICLLYTSIPYAKDINIEGLEGEVSLDSLEKILDVDKNLWEEEANGIEAVSYTHLKCSLFGIWVLS